jgi:hypothetical protein
LIEACKLIDQMEISQQNQDVQGDTSAWLSASLYEYLLSHLSIAGLFESLLVLSLPKGWQRVLEERNEFDQLVSVCCRHSPSSH